ncbi:MAG: hypothetical protein V7704_22225 [Aurantimonas endophytica]|uniref:Uncharacterized protein n=1 Tax=Aurantimonas endophytica TaxID=1522175 RepID=A0A7W6HH56_9HYPH|nr:hypothetical protein [Aurantimonas endophytica]MBB4005159.1 hypothetical protein [Aurantimonas endophytica]
MRWGRKTEATVAAVEKAAETVAEAAGDARKAGLEKARQSLRWTSDNMPEALRRQELLGSGAVGAGAMGAGAIGALALGAVAIGALAVGAFAIGRLSVGRARVGEAEIGRLRIGQLEIGEVVRPGWRFGPFRH